MKIALIGAGRVARYLGHRLQSEGHTLTGVYSRTETHAKLLGAELNCGSTATLKQLNLDCDIVLMALSDDATAAVASQLKLEKQLLLHTAGSLSIDLLAAAGSPNFGTLYPLFSFSGEVVPKDLQIPFLIETSNEASKLVVRSMAEQISDRVQESTHAQRLVLHLAAVFANNFSNHLFGLSEELLNHKSLTLDLLLPMLTHQVLQLKSKHPAALQTGPAIRGDKGTMQRHLDMLADRPDLQAIYSLLSDSIQRTAKS